MKRFGAMLLTCALLVTLTACRSRTTTVEDANPETAEHTESEQNVQNSAGMPENSEVDGRKVPEPPQLEETQPDAEAPTEEDPDAERKTYSSEADAALTPDAETSVISPDDAADAPAVPSSDNSSDGGGENLETDDADQTVTETVSADEAEDIGTAEDGAAADTVLLYYQTLLRDRLGSLFECQKLQAYWETTTAYTTVFKTSAEHQLILDAGAYDVSAKLLEENLTVDTGWVQRKNPGMIVKVVGPDILGSGVQSTAAAKAAADELTARDGWAGLDAVKNGKILVLSSDLLTTQARKTAAAVYLSKEMYPSLFEDVDADEALRLLTEEAGGTPLSGIFAYAG